MMAENANMRIAPSFCQLERFNLIFFAVATILAPYFYVRGKLFGSPSELSVLLEWLALIAITGLLMRRQGLGPNWLRLPVALLSMAFIFRAVIDTQPSGQWPMYWFGFGITVLLITVSVACLAIAVLCWRYQLVNASRHRLDRGLKYLLGASGWIVIAWAVPSLLQPMDAWLNIGDATEKVLDEVVGWAVGNIPGVHSSWVANSFLGLPLAPLSLTAGFGEAKIILVVLYVNFLILAIPLCMGWIIRQSIPALGRPATFAIAIASVTISGSPINTSIFQELSFLARGLLPVAMAALTVHLLAKNLRPSRPQVLILSVGGSIAFWNNFEYGFGVFVAIMAAILTLSEDVKSAVRQFFRLALGFALSTLIVVAPGIALGGNWLGRRVGAFGEVFGGRVTTQSYNNLGSIPEFGLPTLCFVLGVAGVTLGFHELRRKNVPETTRAGAVSSLYFGVWTMMSAPYFLNGGGSGAGRTQFLNIQIVMLVFSILGILAPKIADTFQLMDSPRRILTPSVSGVIAVLPILLLCSLAVGSVVQAPNGVKEWRRVQTPATADRHLDEWSPERLDWIRPSLIPELVKPFGGVQVVGWWFSYGNAVEALTGVENLLGTTGYETARTQTQLNLACEPLIRSQKRYVISIGSARSLLSKCAGIKVITRTKPNDDGLVVFEVVRSAKSPTN
jgi:hypothetical protein